MKSAVTTGAGLQAGKRFYIHCIALCKNEADVIADCLLAAAEWADFIYVYDGGSTDGTWEIVQALKHPAIVPWKQDGKVFREGLRAEVFNHFRQQSRPGDWWLQLNVDEFYDRSPRELFERVPAHHDFVWGVEVEYVLTEKELEQINFSRPFREIRPLFRHYLANWSEPRAFRYRERLVWRESDAWPIHAGLVAKERLIYKHYPCRSPRQLEIRWATRAQNRERGFEGWIESNESRRRIVRPSADFSFDDGVSPLRVVDAELPRHIERPFRRVTKHVMHGLGIWP